MAYPFELKPLNYSYEALEPFIDAATMELHHSKHLNTYVTTLNGALENHPELHGLEVEELLAKLNELPEAIRPAVRNHGGGTYNHNFFFDLLKKDVAEPTSGPLYDAIIAAFGSFDQFKADFKQAGLTQFGSGWAWLVTDATGSLSLLKTPNQDTPIPEGVTPVIGVDVWEHAYYLKCQNRRPEYIDNFFNVVDWNKAEANYLNR
ncbi:MAG: superoxide dismutase [Defluviitaleaceae bacterium]|nr:superoxide dismutase [Defluviitaleaceae bacterium]